MKPAASVDEARELIAAHIGRPEDFRLPISDQLQDPIGANMAVITDAILERGWEPDGYMQDEGFRTYKYKTPARR